MLPPGSLGSSSFAQLPFPARLNLPDIGLQSALVPNAKTFWPLFSKSAKMVLRRYQRTLTS